MENQNNPYRTQEETNETREHQKFLLLKKILLESLNFTILGADDYIKLLNIPFIFISSTNNRQFARTIAGVDYRKEEDEILLYPNHPIMLPYHHGSKFAPVIHLLCSPETITEAPHHRVTACYETSQSYYKTKGGILLKPPPSIA